MLDLNATAIAAHVLYQEGLLLDRRDWSAWLDLYAAQAVYWVPAWRDEHAETTDPACEVSLIYHDSRVGLEERVMRVRSRQSVTAMPLPRTTHFASNIVGVARGDDCVEAQASWLVHVYDPRTAREKTYCGRYEITLGLQAAQWQITHKKIHLQNDCVAAVLDFYML